MPSTEAQKKASIKWQRENYKRIPLDVTKDQYQKIKDFADSEGESVNGFIKRAISEAMEK